ncbi:uncharacterized protein METZ01_LOCUS455085, partial [marine metagenome]
VIVAGGVSTRFGGDIPKQFIKINGQEILSFSVKTFLQHPQIDEVIIVSPKNWVDHVSKKYPKCKVVEAGEHRQNSSLNGLDTVSSGAINVLIHDAARPFVSNQIISDCLSSLVAYDASAPIIPSIDSLVKWDGQTASYIDRADIQIIQTPQCFNKQIITDV